MKWYCFIYVKRKQCIQRFNGNNITTANEFSMLFVYLQTNVSVLLLIPSVITIKCQHIYTYQRLLLAVHVYCVLYMNYCVNNTKHIPYLILRADPIEISGHVTYVVSCMHSIIEVLEFDLELWIMLVNQELSQFYAWKCSNWYTAMVRCIASTVLCQQLLSYVWCRKSTVVTKVNKN